MRYEGSVFRPPSEANSFIVQATVGCSHNKCTFCSMYKDKQFRIRPLEEVLEDLAAGRAYYSRVDKVFIADGNALAMESRDLAVILQKIRDLFPECRRVGIYSAPKDIAIKSVEELTELRQLGLSIAYLGIESGNDQILRRVGKGVTAAEIIAAGRRIRQAGIKLSATLISGLGGRDLWRDHAVASAEVVNAINPDYLGLLTLLIQPGTKLYNQVQSSDFQLLTPEDVMQETALLIEHLEVEECIFRSNHASNYLPLAGTLPEDKDKLLATLRQALKQEGRHAYRDERFRRL